MPAAPKRPGHARLCHCGNCSAVLVRIQVTRNSADRHCDSCSDALEYRRYAYRCESCARITCTQCTSNLRSGARRLISPVRNIRSGAVVRSRRCKRPRLSPAAGAAESEGRTTEQQPADTASADEHERAQMADEHERLSPVAGAAESEVHTTEQQLGDTASADERERAKTAEKHERAKIRETLEIYRVARAARGDKVKKVGTMVGARRSNTASQHVN